MLGPLQIDKRVFKYFDYTLMIQILPLLLISSFLIDEINPVLFEKQMLYYGVGAVAFFVSAFIPWRKILWWFAPLLYTINLLLLVAVDLVGKTILGAQRWLVIPGTGLTIQPSEFVKVSVIMMLAYIISKKPPTERGYGLLSFLKLSLIILIPFLLIAKEPDLGTALVLVITGFGILFVIGINWKIWVVIAITIGFSAPVLYSHLHDYQKKRITDFLGKPSYHVQQALIAIGSGGAKGKAKDEATQTQLKFLPISSSDFIFAYLGERFGFVGMGIVIVLYILLILHLFGIAIRNSTDYMVRTFSSGIALLIFIYMTVNIYMIIGLAPVVGVPLPMFSHGGTSFIIFAVVFGILQNLLAFKKFLMYNPDSKISMTPTETKSSRKQPRVFSSAG